MAPTYEVKVLLTLIWFLANSTILFAAKLNVPKVLLPYYSSVATNFTLEVSEGCYTWRSSRPEVATVIPLGVQDPSQCSKEAVVSANSKSPHRMTTIVLAEDSVSGQILRCDIIVDVIHKIEIETTTRELYLEDSPEAFTVRALDEEGNTFSSLEGVAFKWNLISDTDVDSSSIIDAHNVLRIQTFTESVYETPPHIGKMEAIGMQGHMILVHGIKTGSAKVQARLSDPAYKSVNPVVVRLIVVANLVLSPPDVYLLKYSQVKYTVELIRQGKAQDIPMPSQQYYLELLDNKICSLDRTTSTVTATQLGDTELVLKDRNINIKDTFHQPTAGIHVVNPGYLGFVALPGRKWVLETNREYVILIEIYDIDSHRIHPSDNVRIDSVFPEEYIKVKHSMVNGSYHIVHTVKKGLTEISGKLKAIITQDGKEFMLVPPIEGMQEVEIYDPIQVEPPILVFPWDPITRASYQYTLKATGGSGNYTWTSSKSSVAAVNVKGEITTANIGETAVTAADVRNTAHTGSSKVYVLPPIDLQFIPSKVEAELGSNLDLPLALFAETAKGERYIFNDCRKVPINVTVMDTAVFEEVDETLPLLPDSCMTVRVRALRLGHTKIVAEYSYAQVKLRSVITIAAYKPLQAIDPESVAVVTLGASKEVIFDGGPQPWVLDSSTYFRTLTPEKSDVLSIVHLPGHGTQKTLHIFHVLCRGLEEQELTVSVGNGKTAQNLFPAVATASIRFACAPPVGLHLQPDIKQADIGLPPCPISLDSAEPIPVHCYKNLDILVTVTDSQGRKFDNFSSLVFDWDVSDHSLASLDSLQGVDTDVTVLETGRKLVRCFKTLYMKEKLGSLTVTATVQRYDRKYFTLARITYEESIDPPISRSLELMLVEDSVIVPAFISIFNHPSNKVSLKVEKGSGHFKISSVPPNIAQVSYDGKKKIVQVSPVHDGFLAITAFDLCLDQPQHARSEVSISGVSLIQVKVVDKVELGRKIVASVRVLDHDGKPLAASYFPLMNLKPQTGSEIISVRPDHTEEFTAFYIVHGLSLGQTSLSYLANLKSGELISSEPKDIQVFPPLRLDPRNITLIIGAQFQVTSYGGPQPQSTVDYSILDPNIASISSGGLIDAESLGDTTVVGKAVGMDSETGETVIYSQDQVTVYVVQLAGINVFAPLTRLQTGTEMPLYAMGMNEHETPFTFGTAVPPLSFYWTINNKEVVELKSVYYKSNLHVPAESNFATHLFARKEGHVTVKLVAKPHPDSMLQLKEGVKLEDEVQIQVFGELRLISPASCDGHLIMTPNTETVVKTNRDGTARVTYKIIREKGDSKTSSPLVSVSKTGQVTSGLISGQATLLVTAHEDFGVNQTLVILIKVKPVSYLKFNLDTVIRTSEGHLHTIPVGTTLRYTISYHDDVGEKFYAVNTKLKYRPSRFDLLQVSPGSVNGTLVARTTDVGLTVLKVWDKLNPRTSDYIKINVGYAIQPMQAEVVLGEVICLHSSILSEQGYRGEWSAEGSALTVNPRSGIAVATQVGKTFVHYTVSNDISTYTEIIVAPVQSIHIVQDNLKSLTNVVSRSRSWSIPVILSKEQGIGSGNIMGSNCSGILSSEKFQGTFPYRCELTMSRAHSALSVGDLFKVSPDFDSQTGQYSCKVTQVDNDLLQQEISTLETDVQLQVTVTQREHQPKVTSTLLSVPFYPAFHVMTTELLLSNLQPLSSIRVSSVGPVRDEIKVVASDPSLLEILSQEADSQTPTIVHYPVRLLEKVALWELENLELRVELTNGLTGQHYAVPVRVKLIGQRQDGLGVPQIEGQKDSGWSSLLTVIGHHYQTWLFMLLCIIATISAIVIGYHAVMGQKYSAAPPQSGAFLQPGSPPTSPYYAQSPAYPSWQRTPSPGRPSLWSSGYDPQDSVDTSFIKRSPHHRSPYQ